MTRRRRSLVALVIMLAATAAWPPYSNELMATFRHYHLLDAATGILWVLVFVLAARWIGWSRAGRRLLKGAGDIPRSRPKFRNNPLLWAGFALSLFIVLCSTTSKAASAPQGSFFHRLTDRSSEAQSSAGDLAAEGVLHLGMAIVFGWAAHVFVLVGLDILAGRSGADAPEARTVDECAAYLHAAGWSVGESCFMTDAGLVWQVDGTNGENRLLTRAASQAGAWRAACTDAFANKLSDSTWSALDAVC